MIIIFPSEIPRTVKRFTDIHTLDKDLCFFFWQLLFSDTSYMGIDIVPYLLLVTLVAWLVIYIIKSFILCER
jgi:hypothetical protein